MKNQPRLRSSLAPTYITFYGGGVRSAPPRKVRTASTMNTKKAIFAAKKAMPLISPKPNKAAIKAITRNRIAKRNIEKSPSNFPFDANSRSSGMIENLSLWSYRHGHTGGGVRHAPPPRKDRRARTINTTAQILAAVRAVPSRPKNPKALAIRAIIRNRIAQRNIGEPPFGWTGVRCWGSPEAPIILPKKRHIPCRKCQGTASKGFLFALVRIGMTLLH